MDLSLKKYHALVCGASTGIGEAIALELARQGAELTLLARSETRLQAVAEKARTLGARATHILVADLDRLSEAGSLLEKHLEKSGHVQILINNTGGPLSGPILEAKEEDFLATFSRHILAAHFLLKKLLPGMKASNYGRIVNIISTSVKEPIPGLGVSNTIRGAMASWSKSVSNELPPGITINNILPGYTDTDRLAELRTASASRRGVSEEQILKDWLALIPEGRLAEASEIANAVAFLVSPAAAYIRGVSLAVDGGRMRSI